MSKRKTTISHPLVNKYSMALISALSFVNGYLEFTGRTYFSGKTSQETLDDEDDEEEDDNNSSNNETSDSDEAMQVQFDE